MDVIASLEQTFALAHGVTAQTPAAGAPTTAWLVALWGRRP